jgi:3',5'-cyclic-AMP phosphodiesterase
LANRREFLRAIAAGVSVGAAALVPGLAASSALFAGVESPGSFDFIFFTDTHIQPELDASHGCAMCFSKIRALKPDFAINGGDHVFDAMGVAGRRANELFDLYEKSERALGMPLYHTIGNHDLFGVLTQSGARPSDPGYGKKMYEERFGRKTYYSFDYKGYHFVVLDSVQPTADRLWDARVDEGQLAWLGRDLERVGPLKPLIVVNHVPLVSGFGTYSTKRGPDSKYSTVSVGNSPEVLAKFEGYNVLAVLQGHLHVNEFVSYKGVRYATCGAVCGNWWHGPRMGFPEGFTVVSLREGKIEWRYETYGFKSVDPRE